MAMASHATWHNDCLPSTFPPTSSVRQHGLVSSYSPDFLTSDNQLDISIEGGKSFDDDDDFIYPLAKRPSPVSLAAHRWQGIDEFLDPMLCITPEKSKGSLKRTCLKGGRDTDRVDLGTDRTTPKVHFDSTVEVKQMSPEYSSIEVCNDSSAINRLNGLSSSGCDITNTSPGTSNSSDHIALDTPAVASLQNKSVKSCANIRDHESELEPISVIASNIQDFPTMLSAKGTKRKSRQKQKLSSISGVDSYVAEKQLPTGSKSKFCELRSNIGEESVFTRAEFNSTLRIRHEVQQLENKELDVCEAVRSKLKVSDQTRNQLEEKAYSHVNVADLDQQQFHSLVAVDVHQDELEKQVATEEAAKVRPVMHRVGRISQELQDRAPDAMGFFSPDLQWETACYTTDGLLPPPPSHLLTADLTHAFDVYRHIRAWEKW